MRRKRMIAIVLVCWLFCAQMLCTDTTQGLGTVEAATTTCTTYDGSNVEAQNYWRWSSLVTSYLSACSDGRLMRVQYGSNIEGVLVEYYDSTYNLLETKMISIELPLFGGFYETDSSYFLLTGQTNLEESADVEVYRITKYDKNWNRITSVGLYDCNTTVPFNAGSARMDSYENYLLIRTCHTMYASSDGYNHQANVMIQVDMDTMTITDSYTGVMNVSCGYVSHSFNQFIKVEDGHIVSIDHGDAYPRSIVLVKYPSDVMEGTFLSWGCTWTSVLEFAGDAGENTTGATVGGFELSDTSYLILGNSVVQDDSSLSRTTRNVFVASVAKDSLEVKQNWLTSFEEGDKTTLTPQMVKIDNNRFVVLWSRENENKVYYKEIDGDGNVVGATYTLRGNLSDCVPIISGGKIIWYTWKDEIVTFYDICIDDLSQSHAEVIENGHHYENKRIVDGIAYLHCLVCGEDRETAVYTSMMIWWNETGGTGTMYWAFNTKKEVGETVHYFAEGYPTEGDKEWEVLVSNPDIISLTQDYYNTGYFTMLQPGRATITIRPKLNPELSYSVKVRVMGDYEIGDVNEDGSVDIQDLRLVLRYVCGKEELTEWQIMVVDVAGDENIDIQDLRKVLRFVCGKIDSLE